MKSGIYLDNSTSQTLAVGDSVNLGTVVRRYGKDVNASNGNVVLGSSGYYDVAVNVTVAGSAAGTLVLTLYQDGIAVPGATTSTTTSTTSVNTLPIIAKVRKEGCCPCNRSTLTVVVSGVAATVTNVATTVDKV